MKTIRADEHNYLLHVIYYVWKRNPHSRLGQLISRSLNPSQPCIELFHIKDTDLAKSLMQRFGGGNEEPCWRTE